MGLIRCFLAIEYPIVILDRIKQIIKEMQSAFPPGCVRWVPEKNLHLTVKFLGEINETQMNKLRINLRPVCADSPPISLHITGKGVFPNFRGPRIIWVGAEESMPLRTLVQRCEEVCAQTGIPTEERPFKPHLTIGRTQRDISETDARLIGEYFRSSTVPEFGQFIADHVVLFRSELHPAGPVYSPIETFLLQR